MKPLNLIALLLFLGGTIWALTRSERAVRDIQSAYYSAISPFLKSGSRLESHARAFLEETERSKTLEARLDSMRGELGRLRIIEAQFRDLEDENIQFRHALGFKTATRFNVIGANIVRRQPTTWWQTVEIDAGEESGIGIQLVFLTNEGLVGKIDRVEKNRSSVLLLTDEKCQVSAKVEGSREVGILSGQRTQAEGEPRLRLKYLSKDAVVKPGQLVRTTGLGGIFPPNIILGTIESVEKGALNSEALVKPAVDFGDLRTVFVALSADT